MFGGGSAVTSTVERALERTGPLVLINTPALERRKIIRTSWVGSSSDLERFYLLSGLVYSWNSNARRGVRRKGCSGFWPFQGAIVLLE